MADLHTSKIVLNNHCNFDHALRCREHTELQERVSSLQHSSRGAAMAEMLASAQNLAVSNELDGLRSQLKKQAAAAEARHAAVRLLYHNVCWIYLSSL